MDRSGELPSPTKEQSGEPEGAVERRSAVNSHLLGRRSFLSLIAAGGLSLLTPLERRGLEAAEIPKGATWIEGIQTLRKGALSDNGETHYTYYIDNQTRQGKWIYGKKGELRKVRYSFSDIEVAVNREITSAPTQSIINGILHLHDLSSALDNGDLTKEEALNIKAGKRSISLPPSDLDIDSWKAKNLETSAKSFAEKGIAVEYRTGVIDPAGIWYYRRANEQELPDYYEEMKQRSIIRFAWEDTVSPALKRLDAATLDKLHRFTMRGGNYDPGESVTRDYSQFSQEQIIELKRTDLIGQIHGNERIMQELFGDNPKVRKLRDDFMTQVVKKEIDDSKILDDAYRNWVKLSKGIRPEQLLATTEYTKIREAYKLFGTLIRFAPHSQIANEPPCAGTDYNP